MGRAFLSKTYRSQPAVRSEPAPPEVPQQISYEKWSITNSFDPDSDEFFSDAQYEAFIEPEQYVHPDTMPPLLEVADLDSSSSEGDDSDRGSPMAVGADDPVALLASAYLPPSEIWERIEPWGYGEWTEYNNHVRAAREAGRNSEMPDLIRISDVRVHDGDRTPPPSSPGTRRYSISSPVHNIVAPSPAPVIAPRIYTWGHNVPSPSSSPSRSSPLTNPSARMSLARITPIRVRVQGFPA